MNGQWCDDREVVKDKVKEFFKSTFVKYEGVPVRLDNIKFNSISGEGNCMLEGEFSKEEIKSAVWSCDSSNSYGSNGFNFGFIKFCWEFLSKDILSVINEFVTRGR